VVWWPRSSSFGTLNMSFFGLSDDARIRERIGLLVCIPSKRED
jgi:hypothetical protein